MFTAIAFGAQILLAYGLVNTSTGGKTWSTFLEEHNLAKGEIRDISTGISTNLPASHNRVQAINALEKKKGTIRDVSQHLNTLADLSHGYTYPPRAGFVDRHENTFLKNSITRGFKVFEEVEGRDYWSRLRG
ncbi:hypothetical protein FA15DRAFT_654798 [Coprinopsis marcescibilis]|uniref:Uncharacterized protein n=1 Tax=Coprinopsis marcescibilis TaxID=230819 RepID=A0A5C3L000_COPMA|nr:hypothetical protein FA15DRAFT_654798 [Coprinopsis marcescibilis]